MSTMQLKRAAMRAAQTAQPTIVQLTMPERVWFKNVSHDNGHVDCASAILIKMTPNTGGLKTELSLFDSVFPNQFLVWEEIYQGSLNETLIYLREHDVPSLIFTTLMGGEW